MAIVVSNNFINAIKSNAREFNFKLTVNDSTYYILTRDDMYSFETNHELESFAIGGVSSKELKIVLDTTNIRVSDFMSDTKLKLEVGILINGSFEYCPVGEFYIYKSIYDKNKLTITAYDMVYKMASMQYEKTAPRGENVAVSEILKHIGLYVSLNINAISYSFGDFHINIGPDEELSIRDMLNVISSLTGHMFIVRNNGSFKFLDKEDNSFYIDNSNYFEAKFENEVFRLKSLTVKSLTTSFTYDNSSIQPNGIDLEIENDYANTHQLGLRIFNSIKNRTVEGHEVRLPGLPFVELGDMYRLNDTEADEHEVNVLSHRLSMNGGGLVSTFSCKVDSKASNSLKKTYYNIRQSMDRFSTQIESTAKEIALRAKQEDLEATNTAMAQLELKVDSFTVDFTGTSNNMCPDSNLRAFQEGRTSPSWGWWVSSGEMTRGADYYKIMSGFKYRGFVPSINGQTGNVYVDITEVESNTEYRIEFDYLLENNTYGSMGEVHILYFDDNGQTGGDGSWRCDKNRIYRPSRVITTPSSCNRMRIHWLHPGTNGGANSLLFVGTVMVTKGQNTYTWQPKSDELSSANFSMRPNGQFSITAGNGNVILSADGIPNCYSTSVVDNCDTQTPCNLTFFIDREINRVDRCKLFLSSEWFRAYSKAASDGGSTTQTSSGSGDHRHDMFYVGSPSYSNTLTPRFLHGLNDNIRCVIGTEGEQGSTIQTRSSSGSHSHSVSLPNHTHGLDFGLYEENPNSELHWVVTVDGTDLPGYYSDGAEIDVSSRVTTSGRHTIRCTPRKAGGADVRARCTIALDIKTLQNGR